MWGSNFNPMNLLGGGGSGFGSGFGNGFSSGGGLNIPNPPAGAGGFDSFQTSFSTSPNGNASSGAAGYGFSI